MPRVRVLHLLVVLLVAGTAAPAYGQPLPDVKPSAPSNVRVVQREGRWFLGFAMEANTSGREPCGSEGRATAREP
jgi:hypothetical protein